MRWRQAGPVARKRDLICLGWSWTSSVSRWSPAPLPLVIIGTGDLGKPAFTIPTVCQCQCHNRTGWFHA